MRFAGFLTIQNIIAHGYTVTVSASEEGAGFDIADSKGEVFASEWDSIGTFENAKGEALGYAAEERRRSGRDGIAAEVAP